MRGLMADTKPIHDQCVNAQTFTHTLLDLPGNTPRTKPSPVSQSLLIAFGVSSSDLSMLSPLD